MRRIGRWFGGIAVALGTWGMDPGSARGQVAPSLGGIGVDEYRARRAALAGDLRASGGEGAVLRRALARAEGGDGSSPPTLVVVVGGGAAGDRDRFHQGSDFRYLTGIDQPGAAAILRVDRDEEALYLPPRNRQLERYTGPMLGPGPEAASATGFGRVAPTGEFLADLFRALNDPLDGRGGRGATVYLIEPASPELEGGRDAWLARLVRQGAPGARARDLAGPLHERRKTKSPAEVALIRRAIAATAGAQASVGRLASPGVAENRLEGAILDAFRAAGAQGTSFPSIVGSGPNSTVLHYERNDRTLGAGELVVVDIGAEVEGYAADVTRTIPADGRFTPRQREVYQLVLDAQAGAAREVQPGTSTIGALNLGVIRFFRASPLRGRDESGVERTMDHFFTHGLGHHLGLDVHDVGDASKPLQPGQVFTIEPGLYLPTEGFGVRIEDDYLVTPTGVEKLSAAIPSTLEAIERPALTLARPGRVAR